MDAVMTHAQLNNIDVHSEINPCLVESDVFSSNAGSPNATAELPRHSTKIDISC